MPYRRKGGLVLYNALGQMLAKNLGQGKHPDGQGLWLVKRSKDAGKWILRLVVSGKRREMGLGRWPDVSIAEARERAAAARKQVRDGFDPIGERLRQRHAPGAITLAEAVKGCLEARQAELKSEGTSGRWMSALKLHVLPKLGKLPVEEIDQHNLKATFEPIWQEKPEAARKALNRINLTLKHAAALGLNVDLQATMKAKALLGKQKHKATHIPALAYVDAPKFYVWLHTFEQPPRSFRRSVGMVVRGIPALSEASPVPPPQPIPLCSGREVPAWGIARPFPFARCAEGNTKQAPSADALIASSSRCLLGSEHRDAPVTTKPRGG